MRNGDLASPNLRCDENQQQRGRGVARQVPLIEGKLHVDLYCQGQARAGGLQRSAADRAQAPEGLRLRNRHNDTPHGKGERDALMAQVAHLLTSAEEARHASGPHEPHFEIRQR